MSKTESQEILDSMTVAGKEMTINIEIADSAQAQQLMGTMYGHNVEEFGVKVTSWGFYDLSKANAERIRLIKSETERHQMKLSNIFSMSDRAILEQQSEEGE